MADEDDEPEEKTAAIDPAALGLLDEDDEPEEKTAAIDPAALGLLDEGDEPEEKTAAIDPAALGLLDEGPAHTPDASSEDRTVAMSVPPEFDDDDDSPPAPKPRAQGRRVRGGSRPVITGPDSGPPPPAPPSDHPPGPPSERAPKAPAASAPPARSGIRTSPPTGPPPVKRAPPTGPAPKRSTPPTGPPPVRRSPPTGPPPVRRAPPTGPVPTRAAPPTGPLQGAGTPSHDALPFPLPVMIGAGAALALVLGLVLWLFVFDSSEPAASATGDESSESAESSGDERDDDAPPAIEMAVPSSSPLYLALDLKRIWKSWLFKAVRQDVEAHLEGSPDYVRFNDRTDLEFDDALRMEVGVSMNERGPAPLALIKFRTLDADGFISWMKEISGGDTTDVEDTTFHLDARSGTAVGLIDARRVALGTPQSLEAATGKKRWKSNDAMTKAMSLLSDDAAIRAVATLVEEIASELPMDEGPGTALKIGDGFGVSLSTEDPVVLEIAFAPTGETAEERKKVLHDDLKELLQLAKKQRKAFADEMKGTIPQPAIDAALAALKSLKLKRRDDGLYVRTKIDREVLEPLLALGRSMAPPAPPKADVPPKAKPTEADTSADKAAGSLAALPESCKRVVTCCDALARKTPEMAEGCDAQRKSFEAVGEAPGDARAAMLKSLDTGCAATLKGYAQMPGAPAICSTD